MVLTPRFSTWTLKKRCWDIHPTSKLLLRETGPSYYIIFHGLKIGIRDSKFGEALVFVVRPTSGGYVLGFKADPRERLRPLLSELQILHRAYNERPVFGLEVNWSNEACAPISDEMNDLEEIGEPRGEMGPNLYLASVLAQNKQDGEIQPVYNTYLGLAIEPMKEGLTLKSLIEVQTAV